jgi:hypothetical protein
MSRPRRRRRVPVPTALEQVSALERALWAVSGPLIEGDGHVLWGPNRLPGSDDLVLYHSWPDWPTFFGFYRHVREAYLGEGGSRALSVVERLYAAWQRGEPVGDVVERMDAERRGREDPRWRLFEP